MIRTPFRVGVALLVAAACAGPDSTRFRDARKPAPSARPDKPDAAMAWRMLRWRDERGNIPERAVERALRARSANLPPAAAPANGGLRRGAWVDRGPDNIGGRTRALLTDPRDANKLLAGSVGGGLWHSADSGTTWQRVDDWLPNLAVCCLARDPGNPDTIYAGTGEGFFNADAVRGMGILKSTDGGKTFQPLKSTVAWRYVNRIAISHADTSILLAGTRFDGLQRSVDGGLSWTQVVPGYVCHDVDFDPFDANNAVASVAVLPRPVWADLTHRVVFTTDAGRTWKSTVSALKSVKGLDGRIELSYSPSKRDAVFASTGDAGGKIYRSPDGGQTFGLISRASTRTGVGWYYNALWVDPTDDSRLMVGSLNVYRSADGGATFAPISAWQLKSSPHADAHVFVEHRDFDGKRNKRVYVATDGGVAVAADYSTATSRSGWTRLDKGYRTVQFYGAAGHGPTDLLVGGTQDNGTLSVFKGTRAGHESFGGDGGFCAIDHEQPQYTYGEYIYLRIHRSTNGGRSARYIYNGITDATGGKANFIAPFILDPNRPQRMLGGGLNLWRHDNVRALSGRWTSIKTPIGTDRASIISAIAVARGDSDSLWVGHNGGKLFKTANATAAAPSWTLIDDNGATNPLPDRYVTRVLVDARQKNTVYVTLGGWTPDNVWRTTDGGKTFAKIVGQGASALPPAPVNGIAQHPELADHLYVATEVGVFATDDGGRTWSTTNEGPASVSVDEVVFVHGTNALLAATHGRGLFTIDVKAAHGREFGVGCKGAPAPTLGIPTIGRPKLGGVLVLEAKGLKPNLPATFFIGTSKDRWGTTPLPFDLTPLGLIGCSLLVSPDLSVPFKPTGSTYGWPLIVPNNPWLAGQKLYAQTLSSEPGRNPLNLVLSNGVEVVFGY